jgi:hypothetical protein
MNECWNFFKYAKLEDLESINQLVVKNSKWFSHLSIDHFRKKIIRKECIYENGVVLSFRITKKVERLGKFKILKNNTILEQIVRDNLEIKNSYAEHVFTKFINCAVGNTYLSVNINNSRAISFYKKMRMVILEEYISKIDNKKRIIFMYKKNVDLNIQ